MMIVLMVVILNVAAAFLWRASAMLSDFEIFHSFL
jgi:hypothetical protein